LRNVASEIYFCSWISLGIAINSDAGGKTVLTALDLSMTIARKRSNMLQAVHA
jgi:hypothetical protein